jgi:hypothetical protein
LTTRSSATLQGVGRQNCNIFGMIFPSAGRSTFATKFGIVAASQPLAAQAGVGILERGGHAVDAAIGGQLVGPGCPAPEDDVGDGEA